MRAFLLTYSNVLPPDFVHQVLNNTGAIQTWLSPFPYSAIVLSDLTVGELSAVLRTHFSGAWFLTVEINQENSNGWMAPQFWECINDPEGTWSKRFFAQLASTPGPSKTNLPATLQKLLEQGKKKP